MLDLMCCAHWSSITLSFARTLFSSARSALDADKADNKKNLKCVRDLLCCEMTSELMVDELSGAQWNKNAKKKNVLSSVP